MPNRAPLPLRRTLTATAVALVLGVGAQAATAQAALDEEGGAPPPTSDEPLVAPAKTHLGLGVRIRSVRIPASMLKWFIEDVPGGVSNVGLGLELVRRKGSFEFSFGLEYEHLTVVPGLYLEKGKAIQGGNVDRVVDDGFRWITAEVSFMNHTPIIPQLEFRYGGGAGIGIFQGSVNRTDQACAGESFETCVDAPAPNDNTPYDTPPVMLVVNAIIGLQIKPTDALFINVEGGLRTVPFFGTTIGYYF